MTFGAVLGTRLDYAAATRRDYACEIALSTSARRVATSEKPFACVRPTDFTGRFFLLCCSNTSRPYYDLGVAINIYSLSIIFI